MKEYIKDFIKTVIPAFLAGWFICTFLIANTLVPSPSMADTIPVGARVIGNRLDHNYERGDILIFNSNHDNKILIKRLIGLPGDIIEIVPNNDKSLILLNGEEYDESYLKEPMEISGYMKFEVPEGKYFFLGDNRNDSYDSRYWEDPFIEEEEILAKAVFMIWPEIKRM